MRKIIDCFIFYNELDMLKFRLKELNNVVDYFVLVEADSTFSGMSKELFFEKNKLLFYDYLDKIVHVIVTDMPNTGAWDREFHQRDAIDRGLKKIDIKPDDIIIISDLDEICDVDTLLNIKNNGVSCIYHLKQDMFYYNLNCKGENWFLAKICNYGSYLNISKPNLIRIKGNPIGTIEKGGWHFSYFFDVDGIVNKIKSFSHQEYNNDKYTNKEIIKELIKNCDDLFFRDNASTHNFKYFPYTENNYLPRNYEMLSNNIYVCYL